MGNIKEGAIHRVKERETEIDRVKEKDGIQQGEWERDIKLESQNINLGLVKLWIRVGFQN